jgi:hypothetical protein
VALVANVPEGLDASGWRAAVLATVEADRESAIRGAASESLRDDFAETIRTVHRAVTTGQQWIAFRWGTGCAAYARALVPQSPRPAPYRRKSPGLPLDMGEG